MVVTTETLKKIIIQETVGVLIENGAFKSAEEMVLKYKNILNEDGSDEARDEEGRGLGMPQSVYDFLQKREREREEMKLAREKPAEPEPPPRPKSDREKELERHLKKITKKAKREVPRPPSWGYSKSGALAEHVDEEAICEAVYGLLTKTGVC